MSVCREVVVIKWKGKKDQRRKYKGKERRSGGQNKQSLYTAVGKDFGLNLVKQRELLKVL